MARTFTTEEVLSAFLDWRGIDRNEDACPDCGGAGVKAYANTATYHAAAIAGQAITNDVCDSCWGSGNKHHPWPSHKLLKR